MAAHEGRALRIYSTAHEDRRCYNCARFSPLDQWAGHCEEHDQATEADDKCERWDGE